MIRQITRNSVKIGLTSIQILDSDNEMDELGDYEEEPMIVTRKKKTDQRMACFHDYFQM